MKTVIKLFIAACAMILPLLLASCDTSILEQLTSGKSFMELAMESYEEKAALGEKTSLSYVIEKDDGTEKAVEIQLDFCGGKINLEDVIEKGDFTIALEKEGFTFEGWYTQPDMGGFQVVDSLGKLVNEGALAECSCHECDGISCIKLYAGFTEANTQSTVEPEATETGIPEAQIVEGTETQSVEDTETQSAEGTETQSAEGTETQSAEVAPQQ